jgi:hypothetical protein
MGAIGVKCWVFKKELFKKTDADLMEEVRVIEKEKMEELARQAEQAPAEPSLLPSEPAAEAEVIEEVVMKEVEEQEDEALRKRETGEGAE